MLGFHQCIFSCCMLNLHACSCLLQSRPCAVSSQHWPLTVSLRDPDPQLPLSTLHFSVNTLSVVKCGSVTSHVDTAFFFSLHSSTFFSNFHKWAWKVWVAFPLEGYSFKRAIWLQANRWETVEISPGWERREGDECYSWKRSTPPLTPPEPPAVPLTEL